MTTHRPFYLGHGAANLTSSDKACLVQRAALLHAEKNGYIDKIPFSVVFTDSPCWLSGAISDLAIACNDSYGVARKEERQALQDLLPRILQAHRQNAAAEKRLSVRICGWLTRKAIQHTDDPEATAIYVEVMKFVDEWWRQYMLSSIDHWTSDIGNEIHRLSDLMRDLHSRRQEDRSEPSEPATKFENVYRLIWSLLNGDTVPSNAICTFRQMGIEYDPYQILEEALDIYEKECAEEGVIGDSSIADAALDEIIDRFERVCLPPKFSNIEHYTVEGDTDDDE